MADNRAQWHCRRPSRRIARDKTIIYIHHRTELRSVVGMWTEVNWTQPFAGYHGQQQPYSSWTVQVREHATDHYI